MERHSTSSSNHDCLYPGSAVCQISNGQFIFGKFNFIVKAIFIVKDNNRSARCAKRRKRQLLNLQPVASLRCRHTKPPVY